MNKQNQIQNSNTNKHPYLFEENTIALSDIILILARQLKIIIIMM